MTLSTFRELILWQIQSVLPEANDWQTMLRLIRLAGRGVNPESLQETPTDPVAFYIDLGLRRYGEVSRYLYGELEIELFAGERHIEYREHGVIDPHLVSWREASSDQYHLLQKMFRYPVRQKVSVETGTPSYWLVQGGLLTVTPAPQTDGYLLVEGVLTPYVDASTQTIRGIEPTDAPAIARWVASYLAEGLFPQIALMWRQESESAFLRRLKETKWYQHRGRRGVRFGRR